MRVGPQQCGALAANASLLALTPVTLLLHKPAGFEAGLGLQTSGGAHASRSQGAPQAVTLLSTVIHLAQDETVRVLLRHFRQLECFTPLPTEASWPAPAAPAG